MQNYRKEDVSLSELLPLAERLRREGTPLAMIHGYVDKEGQPVISYDFAVPGGVDSYQIRGENTLPTLSGVYSDAAAWPEREINELMGIEFTGLDTSARLFLPDSMLDGQGHIIVTPLEELRSKNITHREG